MPDILSQEEIDALLKIVDEEEMEENVYQLEETTGIDFDDFKKILKEVILRVLTGFVGDEDWEMHECYNTPEHSVAFKTALGYVEMSNEFASYFTDRTLGGEGYIRIEIGKDEIDMAKEILGNVLITFFSELNDRYGLSRPGNVDCVEVVQDIPIENFIILTFCFGENRVLKFFIPPTLFEGNALPREIKKEAKRILEEIDNFEVTGTLKDMYVLFPQNEIHNLKRLLELLT